MARITRRAQHFDAELAESFGAHDELHALKSVKMSLTNAQLFKISDLEATERIGKIDPVCLWNVKRHQRIDDRVTMIRSALQADVVFTVQYDRAAKLDASAQVAVFNDVALKLGVDGSTLTGRTIEATGLVWGVKIEDSLVDIFDAKLMRGLGLRHLSAFGPNDAPVVVEGQEIWHREHEVRLSGDLDVAWTNETEGDVAPAPREPDALAWPQATLVEDALATLAAADAPMGRQAAAADEVAAPAAPEPSARRRRPQPSRERRNSLP